MFKVISPFVLAKRLLDSDGNEFRVESLRQDADGAIRLRLRDLRKEAPSAMALSRVLDWKVCLGPEGGNTKTTVLDYLETCYEQLSKWLRELGGGPVRGRLISWKDFVTAPVCFNRGGVFSPRDGGDEPPDCKDLLRWLDEDRDLWRLDHRVDGNGAKSGGPSFAASRQQIGADFDPVEQVLAAVRVARRVHAARPDMSGRDTCLEGYVIAAAEEYCLLCVRDSLQHGLSTRQTDLPGELRLTCTAVAELPVDAATDRIWVKKCADGSVRIDIPWPTATPPRVLGAIVRNTFDGFDLFKALQKEVRDKESVFAGRMSRLKASLEALRLPQRLEFSDLAGLQHWLNAKMVPNPDIDTSIRDVRDWVKYGFPKLQEKDRKKAEEAIRKKVRELIPGDV